MYVCEIKKPERRDVYEKDISHDFENDPNDDDDDHANVDELGQGMRFSLFKKTDDEESLDDGNGRKDCVHGRH